MSNEVLKAVFPLLEGVDLASCMAVCKQWRDVAVDDYFWKCQCAKRWPSICKKPQSLTVTYYKLYQKFHKQKQIRPLPPPRISFDDLEFFIDIWSAGRLIFSEAVPGPVLQTPPRLGEELGVRTDGPEYKMTLPVSPGFIVPESHTVSGSVLVGRKDSDKVACIISKAAFDYVDRSSHRAMAFNFLDLSPFHPFVSGVRAWFSLLYTEDASDDDALDVFAIQLDFCDAANSKEEVLWLLDMLDWK